MFDAQLQQELKELLGQKLDSPTLALLAHQILTARERWVAAERDAILSLVRTWIGDTVEGRDLIASINMRSLKKQDRPPHTRY